MMRMRFLLSDLERMAGPTRYRVVVLTSFNREPELLMANLLQSSLLFVCYVSYKQTKHVRAGAIVLNSLQISGVSGRRN